MKADMFFGIPVELQPDPEIKTLCYGFQHILRFENAEILMLMKFLDKNRKTPGTDVGPFTVVLNPDKNPEEISECFMNAGPGFSGNKNGLKSGYFTPDIYIWPEEDEEETHLPLHVNPNGVAFTHMTIDQHEDLFDLDPRVNVHGNIFSHFAIDIHQADISLAEYYEFRTQQIRAFVNKHKTAPAATGARP